MTTATIERTDAEQLVVLSARRDELAADLSEAESRLSALREALVEGSARPEDVETAQLRMETLRGALDGLQSRISAAEERERQRESAAERQAVIDRLVALTRKAEAATEQLLTARAEAARVVGEAVTRMQKAREELVETRHAFLSLGQDLAPAIFDVAGTSRQGEAGTAAAAAVAALMSEVRAHGGNIPAIGPDWRNVKEGSRDLDVSSVLRGYADGKRPDLGAIGDAVDRAAGFKPIHRY